LTDKLSVLWELLL